jgi:hypothetical protein
MTMIWLILAATTLGAFPQSQQTPRQVALQMLSTARPDVQWDAASVLSADFDCDGRRDQVLLGRSPGKVFIGLVRAVPSKPEILEFAVDASLQAAICQEPAKVEVESLDYDPADAVGKIPGFRRSRTCRGIQLSGGDCDSVHIFWNHQTKHLGSWRA